VPFVFSPRDPAKRKIESKHVKMAGARSENTIISEDAGRSLMKKTSPHGAAERDLRNKTAASRVENSLISGVAGRSLINKTSPCAPAN
jgi:hypothetical protein